VRKTRPFGALLFAFTITLIPTPAGANARDESACKLSYRGVVGAGPKSVAIIHDGESDKMIFGRLNQKVSACSLEIVAMSRGKIILAIGNKRVELVAQGVSNESQVDERSRDYILSGEELGIEQQKAMDRLVDLGSKLVTDGLMTKEEVNQVLADEQMAFEFESRSPANF
jgi:hypothetical protein